jgi:hypothetical protein
MLSVEIERICSILNEPAFHIRKKDAKHRKIKPKIKLFLARAPEFFAACQRGVWVISFTIRPLLNAQAKRNSIIWSAHTIVIKEAVIRKIVTKKLL